MGKQMKRQFLKTFIDYKLIQRMNQKEEIDLPNCELMKALSWPAFLECLEMRSSLFKDLPSFDSQNTLFNLVKRILSTSSEKDLIIRLYDQIFVEALTQIKSIPELSIEFLLDRVQKKKQTSFFKEPLEIYEKLLIHQPYPLLHDLTLYLAWDRMCVYMATLFDDQEMLQGLEILKDCLVESFDHITKQKKTSPSFFRLLEALYAYFLREEHLQIHSKEEWDVFCKASALLKNREELSDVCYIDEFLGSSVPGKALTIDCPNQVEITLALAHAICKSFK